MNRWRWIWAAVFLCNLATPIKVLVYGSEASPASLIMGMAGCCIALWTFCFSTSPFRKDGQGGNIQLPIRPRRHTQR